MAPTLLARVVRWVNRVMAVALVAALAAIYWFAWRPLPETSGTVKAPLEREATVARDSLGVPHIKAATLDDALFTQGYVTAQERLWQMDALRRLAAGELAEVVGPAGLDSDREARRLRLRRMAEEAYLALPAPDRASIAAYARGVNFFIDTHLNRLPVEFTLLGYAPRPWSGVDSILIGLQMFRTLTTSWKTDMARRSMLAAGDPEKVKFLYPARSGGELQPGSNAWALAGSRTASGKPLLASDMHLEYTIPGLWFMVHLQAPGLNASGVSLPGAPGVIVGHNERIAWGITNLEFDVQDLYVEKMDDRTGRYVYRGQVEQARPERDIIQVKGGAPIELLTWVTRHGPLFISGGGEQLTLRWVAADTSAFQFPFVQIDQARDWREFRAALARMPGPGSNFVYADVDGNIGYQVAGRLPIRRNFTGEVPVDGSSGEYEWEGCIPFDQLPSAFNPPGGLIVTANQNPFPVGYPYRVAGNFASHYRSRQIRDLLLARRGWRAEDMLAVQTDVYSGFSHYLARAIVEAYDRRHAHNPQLEDAIRLLRGWNGQMDRDAAAPLIVTLSYQHLRRVLGESAAPGKSLVYEHPMAPAAIEKLLRTRPPGWFRDYDETLLRCLADAVDEGRRLEGRGVERWVYGEYTRLRIDHPVTHELPLVGRYFDIGPVRMSGSGTTVKQLGGRLGPSMRMNADLADWDRSLLNLPIGESGHPLSSHYKDQWSAYDAGRSFPMPFRNVQAKATLRLVPR